MASVTWPRRRQFIRNAFSNSGFSSSQTYKNVRQIDRFAVVEDPTLEPGPLLLLDGNHPSRRIKFRRPAGT